MKETVDLIKKVLTTLLEKKDINGALELISDDFRCYGILNDGKLKGKEEVTHFFRCKIQDSITRGELSFWDEEDVLENDDVNIGTVKFIFIKDNNSFKIRATGYSKSEAGTRKLHMIQLSLVYSALLVNEKANNKCEDVFENNKYQQEVIRANKRLTELLNNVSSGICVSKIKDDLTMDTQYVSQGFCDIYDIEYAQLFETYKSDKLIGIDEENAKKLRDALQYTYDTGKDSEVTYKCTTIKGNEKWITLKMRIDKEISEEQMLYCTYFDVTYQLSIKQELDDLLHNALGGICEYMWDGEKLNPIYTSKKFSDFYGINGFKMMQETRGLDYKLVHPDDLEGLKKFIEDNIEKTNTEHTYTYRVCKKWKGCS